MTIVENLIELDPLYPKILVLELIEKTKNCAVTWDKINPTVFRSRWESNNWYYEAYLVYLKQTYKLDFFRNKKIVYSVNAGLVPEVGELYRLVDLFLGQDEFSLTAIQKQRNAQSILREISAGGIVLSGLSYTRKVSSDGSYGGIIVTGQSDVMHGLYAWGGVIVGSNLGCYALYNPIVEGGVILEGSSLVSGGNASVGDLYALGSIYSINSITGGYNNVEGLIPFYINAYRGFDIFRGKFYFIDSNKIYSFDGRSFDNQIDLNVPARFYDFVHHDRFRNRLIYKADSIIYTFDLDTAIESPILSSGAVEVCSLSNNIITLTDYSIASLIAVYDSDGNLITNRILDPIAEGLIRTIAADFWNDRIWVAGGKIVGVMEKDLLTLEVKYVLDGVGGITGLAINEEKGLGYVRVDGSLSTDIYSFKLNGTGSFEYIGNLPITGNGGYTTYLRKYEGELNGIVVGGEADVSDFNLDIYGKGYFAGGVNDSLFLVALTDKITFSNDTTIAQTSANLSQARLGLAGISEGSTKGYFAGGDTGNYVSTTDKIIFTSDTTAVQSSANLSSVRYGLTGVSEGSTKGYFAGGWSGVIVATTDKIIFAIDTTGAQASANLSQARWFLAGVSEGSTKGYFTGGHNNYTAVVTADKIIFTTDTTGAQTSANLSQARSSLVGVSEGSVKGYFVGGYDSVRLSIADKITFATDITAAQSSANLSQDRYQLSGISEGSVKGYFAGGSTNSAVNTTDNITFATDITVSQMSANLSQSRYGLAGNSTSGV